jgi:hypothetical protein
MLVRVQVPLSAPIYVVLGSPKYSWAPSFGAFLCFEFSQVLLVSHRNDGIGLP